MVLELDPADVADALRAGELDAALIHEYDFAADPAHRGLATTALRTEAMYLAAAVDSGHVVPARTESTDISAIAACREMPWIVATRGSSAAR